MNRAVHQCVHRWSVYTALLTIMAVVAAAPSLHAWPQSLSGSLSVNATEGQSSGLERSSLSQQYALHWKRGLAPYLTGQATLLYSHLGSESELTGEAWREQMQPSADLGWNHPLFSLDLGYRRHESRSQNQDATIVRETAGIGLRTRLQKYPTVSLRYDRDLIYNKTNRRERDSRDDRLQAGLRYIGVAQSFVYTFSHRDGTVRSAGIDVRETAHLVRWDAELYGFDHRLRVTTGYNFDHRERAMRLVDTTSGFRALAVTATLYAHDGSPDFGALDTVAGLNDGITDQPSAPQIDIGELSADQNVGVDLGFARIVNGFYIYTDRPSGAGIGWTIYASDDNLTWDLIEEFPDIVFNTGFSRYEIRFPPIRRRYVKAVMNGLNDVTTVYVTEIAALDIVTDDDTRTQISHRANATAGYRFSDAVGTSAGLYYRFDPASTSEDARDQLAYDLSARYAPLPALTHTLSYQAGWEDFRESSERLSTQNLSYMMNLNPLRTLQATLTAANRRSYIGDYLDQESKGAQGRISGRLFPDLQTSFDVRYARARQHLDHTAFDTWYYQWAVDAGVTRYADIALSYGYQKTSDLQNDDPRIRHQWAANLTLRMSRAVLLRGMVSVNRDDGRRSVAQRYNGTWKLTRKTNLSASLSIGEGSERSRVRRTNLQLSQKVGSRTSVMIGYLDSRTGDNSDQQADSFQIGMRSGF